MQEPGRNESGWSFLKVLGVVVGLMGMAGFGLCSLFGLMFAVGGSSEVIGLVLLGIGLTALSAWLVATMFRKAREERERNQ